MQAREAGRAQESWKNESKSMRRAPAWTDCSTLSQGFMGSADQSQQRVREEGVLSINVNSLHKVLRTTHTNSACFQEVKYENVIFLAVQFGWTTTIK